MRHLFCVLLLCHQLLPVLISVCDFSQYLMIVMNVFVVLLCVLILEVLLMFMDKQLRHIDLVYVYVIVIVSSVITCVHDL